MPLARASELDRLFACPGSAWLPRQDLRTENARRAAAWGDSVHHWVETGEIPLDANARALQKKLEASGTQREEFWPHEGVHEIALAYNVLTQEVRRCPAGEDRATWKSAFDDEWVTGSFDYAADVFGDPWVDDLKTGRWVMWEQYKAQQSFYCLAWGISEYGSIRKTRSTITHWPRYPILNRPNRFGRVLEVDTLKLFQVKLRSLRDTILEARGAGSEAPKSIAVLSLGEHCGFCPSRSQCPVFGREPDSHS